MVNAVGKMKFPSAIQNNIWSREEYDEPASTSQMGCGNK
jgi:hypothetical protein